MKSKLTADDRRYFADMPQGNYLRITLTLPASFLCESHNVDETADVKVGVYASDQALALKGLAYLRLIGGSMDDFSIIHQNQNYKAPYWYTRGTIPLVSRYAVAYPEQAAIVHDLITVEKDNDQSETSPGGHSTEASNGKTRRVRNGDSEGSSGPTTGRSTRASRKGR